MATYSVKTSQPFTSPNLHLDIQVYFKLIYHLSAGLESVAASSTHHWQPMIQVWNIIFRYRTYIVILHEK